MSDAAYGIVSVENVDLSKVTIAELRGFQMEAKGGEQGGGMKTAKARRATTHDACASLMWCCCCQILYDGQPMRVRLPKLVTSWGLSPPLKTDGIQAYRMELSMGSHGDDSPTYKLFAHLDKLCEEKAVANPKVRGRQRSQSRVRES